MRITPNSPAGSRVFAAYDRLLEEIGYRAGEIGTRPVVTHGPHVGGNYRGLVIVGQAPYGWPDDWLATQFRFPGGREHALHATMARNTDRPEPLDWIETSSHRASPWWTCVRALVDHLDPGDAPWWSRFAWVNLYPAAPENPPGNPRGALREAQDHLVGDLLCAVLDAIGAQTVVALVGPFWWPTGYGPPFTDLAERPRPLLRSGFADGRPFVVGWHPGGASRRGTGPYAYADLLAAEVRTHVTDDVSRVLDRGTYERVTAERGLPLPEAPAPDVKVFKPRKRKGA